VGFLFDMDNSKDILKQTLDALKAQREIKQNQYTNVKWELKRIEKEIATIEKLINADSQQADTAQA
jgi:hypothetical protein